MKSLPLLTMILMIFIAYRIGLEDGKLNLMDNLITTSTDLYTEVYGIRVAAND